jgi:hypothetical protein
MIRLTDLTIRLIVTLTCLAGAVPAAAQASKSIVATDDARDLNLRAYTELLRSDIRAQKVAIIAGVMQFSEEDDLKFWPIYREYESELAKVNDDRLALITEYAAAYEQMTDDVANRLAKGSIDLEARRNAVKARYYDRLQSTLAGKTAAQLLQVENQILLLLDLQIAAALPVVR